MKKGLTEVVFIIDKSGSMSGLEADTIGGYNSFLKKQKEEEGEAVITTVLFDNNYELLHDRINVKGVNYITDKDYFVEGTTALLDAIGKSVMKIRNVQKNTAEEEKAENVIFVIITDGMENASREFSESKIKSIIEHQKKKYNWEFIFLGANIDAITTAKYYGIAENRAVNYSADKEGTLLNFDVVCNTISSVRQKKGILENWSEKIKSDFESKR
ncbi:MAG: vWA domain-containing protein [Lachnospirales bacterium]